MKRDLKTHIRILSHQIEGLLLEGGGPKRLIRDAESGRAYVFAARTLLAEAIAAKQAGDELEAYARLADAQAHYITALRRQVSDHDKLMRRPDAGGRPSAEGLALRLREHADLQEGSTIVARCRAAIRADETLRAAYETASDSTIRRAYSRKIAH